jgi:hypothetical protein
MNLMLLLSKLYGAFSFNFIFYMFPLGHIYAEVILDYYLEEFFKTFLRVMEMYSVTCCSSTLFVWS